MIDSVKCLVFIQLCISFATGSTRAVLALGGVCPYQNRLAGVYNVTVNCPLVDNFLVSLSLWAPFLAFLC